MGYDGVDLSANRLIVQCELRDGSNWDFVSVSVCCAARLFKVGRPGIALIRLELSVLTNHSTLIKTYYLLTPLFFLLDWLFGWSLRLSTPWQGVGLDLLYYAVCVVAVCVLHRQAQALALFGVFECSFNLLLLMLSVFLPYVTMGQVLSDGQVVDFVFGWQQLLQFVLVGGVLILAFYRNTAILAGRVE